MRVCVRTCVRACVCVRVCVRACARACAALANCEMFGTKAQGGEERRKFELSWPKENWVVTGFPGSSRPPEASRERCSHSVR